MKTFLLHQLYPRALSGLPLLGTPEATAAAYRARRGSLRSRAERMIRPHLALAGTTGFVTGLGGWLTMPLTVPADLAGVALLQLHMAAACAALAGHDPDEPTTREEVVACLLKTDQGARTEEEEAVERVTVKVAERGLRYLGRKSLEWGAAAAGRRMGGRIARGVPFLGGAIGAVSDAYNTHLVARHALDTFFPHPDDADSLPPRGTSDHTAA